MATITPQHIKQTRQTMRLRKVEDVKFRKVSVEKELREAVLAARIEGCSWKEIGKSLGVTEQSAWRKFS